MFESHFGLRENPFVSAHQSRFVFPSREHQEALAHLRFGIENREPFVLITGEVGTGKTTALYDALSEWQSQTAVALITNSALTRSELIEEICLKFNLSLVPPVTKPSALVQLERHLLALRGRGDRAILILDEAQNLGPELLEEIRLLSNLEAQGEKLLQVFLVGQPELEAKLSRPELRQLRQRIAVHYRIHPLGPEDTERYIHHRVTVAGGYAPEVFPTATCLAVYELTHGIPREINQVCAQGMLAAFVEEARHVLPEHVRAVAKETRFRSVAESGDAHAVSSKALEPTPDAEPALPDPVRMPSREASAVAPAPAPAAAVVPASPPPPEPPPVIDTAAAMTMPFAEPAAIEPPALTLSPAVEDAMTPAGTRHAESPTYEHAASEDKASAPTDEVSWQSWLASLKAGPQPPTPAMTSEPIHARPEPWHASAEPEPSYTAPESRSASEMQAPGPIEAVPEPLPATMTEAELLRAMRETEPVESAASASRASTSRAPAHATRLREVAPDTSPTPANGPRNDLRDWRPPKWTPDSERDGLKLDDESSTALRWVAIAIVIAVLTVGGVLLARFKPWEKPLKAAATPAVALTGKPDLAPPDLTPHPATEPAPAPATRPAEVPPPHRAASHANVETKPATTAHTAPAPPAAFDSLQAPATSDVPRAPAPKPAARAYALSVGSWINRDRADTERQRLTDNAPTPVRIITTHENGAAMYTLLIGSFPTRVAAEQAASDLVKRGVVDEARVIGGPKR